MSPQVGSLARPVLQIKNAAGTVRPQALHLVAFGNALSFEPPATR